MRRSRLLPFLVLSLSLLLTACGPSAAPAAPSGAAKPGPRPVSLVLDWYPNAVHAFIYAAQEQGYFEAEGIKLEIKMPAGDPTDGIKLVGAGKETFALYYQPDVLLARGEGIPIVSVAAVVRHPLNGIIVPTASGIASPKDLTGKQVGYPGIPLNLSMVSTMVKNAGGDPSAVKMTDVSWDLIPAIATNQTTAIAGGFLNHEKLLLEKEGIPVTYFAPTDFGVPNYYELVLITGEETVRKDRAVVDAFWRALARGQDWVVQHPAQALALVLKAQNTDSPLDPEIEKQSLSLLLPLMTDAGVKFGAQNGGDWQKVADWMVAGGALKSSVNPAEAFVDITR